MKKFVFLFAFALAALSGFAQSYHLKGAPAPKTRQSPLNQSFSNYRIFHLDANALLDFATRENAPFALQLDLDGFKRVNADLSPNQVMADNYSTRVQTKSGVEKMAEKPVVYTFIGSVNGRAGDRMALTVAKDFIHGSFELDGTTFYIEPLRQFDASQPGDLYVVYDQNDVKGGGDAQCSAIEVEQELKQVRDKAEGGPDKGCQPLEIQIAIASDFRMVQRHGSYGNVIAHNLGVINETQAYWDNDFAKNLYLRVVTQWVSTSPLTEPWPSSNNRTVLLEFFRTWAEGGGFGAGVMYDLGHWRTARVMLNSNNQWVAGASYATTTPGVPVVCTEYRYSVFSESYSTGIPMMSCMLPLIVSYGMGRGFGASNGLGIMNPIITDCSNNYWTASSVAEINSGISLSPCLQEFYCTLPDHIDQPASVTYTCTGSIDCATFNDFPCLNSFVVQSSSPTLTVTSLGKTICVKSEQPGFRSVTVTVTPVDPCGNLGDPNYWTVYIDSPEGCASFQSPGGDKTQDRAGGLAAGLSLRPSNDLLTVLDDNPTPQNKDIRIFDLSGKLVAQRQSADANIEVPLRDLPQGILVVRVTAGAEVVVSKISHF